MKERKDVKKKCRLVKKSNNFIIEVKHIYKILFIYPNPNILNLLPQIIFTFDVLIPISFRNIFGSFQKVISQSRSISNAINDKV